MHYIYKCILSVVKFYKDYPGLEIYQHYFGITKKIKIKDDNYCMGEFYIFSMFQHSHSSM